MNPHRRRVLVAIVLLTALGLPSKWYAGAHQGVVVGQVEDLVGTMVMFLLVRWVLLDAAAWKIGAAVFAAVMAIELSQLLEGPMWETIRATWIGRVTLGRVFDLADVVAYVLAIGLVLPLDRWLARASREETRVRSTPAG